MTPQDIDRSRAARARRFTEYLHLRLSTLRTKEELNRLKWLEVQRRKDHDHAVELGVTRK